ncbi:MAG: hypothetical protein ACO1SX_19875 [Actinomycetota bacterium]
MKTTNPTSLAAQIYRGSILLALLMAPASAVRTAAQGAAPGAPKVEAPIDLGALAKGDGLKGSMHGSVPSLDTYVFTWSSPRGFFQNQNLSLVPATPEVGAQLAAMSRHQAATVWGTLVRVNAGQSHVRVERVRPGEKWDPGVRTTPMERIKPEKLKRELSRKNELNALVHAIGEDGSALVVEYRDEVIPVQVPPVEALRKSVAGLFRGDRVRLQYRIAEYPKTPLHLLLTPDLETGKTGLEVTDSLHALHEQTRTVEGNLVLFPKSPALRRAIWGVEERGPNGLHRYFTIFNFENQEEQAKIDALLQGAWSSSPEGVKDGRNKYIHTRVRVRVTGKVNNPAHNQANPTLITTADQVSITRRK